MAVKGYYDEMFSSDRMSSLFIIHGHGKSVIGNSYCVV